MSSIIRGDVNCSFSGRVNDPQDVDYLCVGIHMGLQEFKIGPVVLCVVIKNWGSLGRISVLRKRTREVMDHPEGEFALEVRVVLDDDIEVMRYHRFLSVVLGNMAKEGCTFLDLDDDVIGVSIRRDKNSIH